MCPNYIFFNCMKFVTISTEFIIFTIFLQRQGRTIGSTHSCSTRSYGRATEKNPAKGRNIVYFTLKL